MEVKLLLNTHVNCTLGSVAEKVYKVVHQLITTSG